MKKISNRSRRFSLGSSRYSLGVEIDNAEDRSSAPPKILVQVAPVPIRLLGAAQLSEQAWTEISRSLMLSGRQLEIVRGIFDNYTEVTIAANLGISEHTVHSHLGRLFQKLHITTRTQLVLRIMQELMNLVESPGNSLPPICKNYASGRCQLNA